MKKDILEDLSYKMYILLGQTKDAISLAKEPEAKKNGLTPRQIAVMGLIKVFGDEATIPEISRWLIRKPNSVLELINRMEKSGLVKMKRDLKRKNQIRVVMTEKGIRLYHKSIKSDTIPKIISSLTDKERQHLIKYLCKIRAKALEMSNLPYEVPLPPF